MANKVTVELTQEELELLATIVASLGNNKGFFQRYFGWGDKEEPTMAGLMKCAERFIRHTMPGLYEGSWSGPSGPYDIHITFKVRQDKTTT